MSCLGRTLVLLLFASVFCDGGWSRLSSDTGNTFSTTHLSPAIPLQLSSIDINDQQYPESVEQVDATPVLTGMINSIVVNSTDSFGNTYIMYSNSTRFYLFVASFDAVTREQRWMRTFYIQRATQDTVYASISLIYSPKSQLPLLSVYIASEYQVQYLASDSGKTISKFELSNLQPLRRYQSRDVTNLGIVQLVSDIVQDEFLTSYFGCGSYVCMIRNMTISRSRQMFTNRSVTTPAAIYSDRETDLFISVADDGAASKKSPILFALDTNDLSLTWQIDTWNSSSIGTPTLYNSSLYITSNDTIFCYFAKNATIRWDLTLNVTLGSRIAIGFERIHVISHDTGFLYCIDATNGSLLWSRSLLSSNVTSDISIGDPVLTGDGSGMHIIIIITHINSYNNRRG
jgi:hypothetical protein